MVISNIHRVRQLVASYYVAFDTQRSTSTRAPQCITHTMHTPRHALCTIHHIPGHPLPARCTRSDLCHCCLGNCHRKGVASLREFLSVLRPPSVLSSSAIRTIGAVLLTQPHQPMPKTFSVVTTATAAPVNAAATIAPHLIYLTSSPVIRALHTMSPHSTGRDFMSKPSWWGQVNLQIFLTIC